ncbi:MAG: DeoR/GlpR family DNA-binding transcription regulator [bacterium]
MLAAVRQSEIKKLIQDEGSVRVSELSKIFKVSGVTIRRDLEKLEQEEVIKRTHGGAVVLGTDDLMRNLAFRDQAHVEEKRRIGKAAARLVKDGNTIILDGGTTTTEIARNLDNAKNLTVVTNAVNIPLALRNNSEITIIMTGGTLKAPSFSLTGRAAAESINHLNVDKTFLSVQGISLEKGLTNTSVSDLYLKRSIIAAAKEVILVADSSKFGRIEFCTVAPITAVHKIITDNEISPHLTRELETIGIEVIVV